MFKPGFTMGKTPDNDYQKQGSVDANQQIHEEMRAAMQEFVDRVDKGEVCSKYHYRKFKEILSALAS